MQAQELLEIKIRRATAKEKEEDRKSGFVTAGAAGGSGVLAAGGAGAGGAGLGGAMLGGGLLATKAGVMALLVAGSTVAGGLGLLGYKVAARNELARQEAERKKMLFAARPKQAAEDLEGVDAERKLAAAEGTSSLQYLADAKSTLGLDRVEQNDEKKEATSADAGAPPAPAPPAPDPPTVDAAASAAATAAIAPPANGNAPAMGAAAKMTFTSKIGKLSSGTGGGASGAHFGSSGNIGASAPMDAGKLMASMGGMGRATAMRPNARASLSSGKGVGEAGRRGGAVRQLNNVMRDQRGAVTSGDAGRTYDGGARTGGNTGAAQSGAAQDPDTHTDPPPNTPGGNSSSGGGTGATQLPAAPDNVEGKNVTPWQGEMNKAKLLIGGAIAGLAIGWGICKWAQTQFNLAAKQVLASLDMPAAGAAAALNAAAKQMHMAALLQKAAMVLFGAAALAMAGALAIGVQIMSGEFNQTNAGLAFVLAGGFGAVAGGLAVKSVWSQLGTTETAAKITDLLGAAAEKDALIASTGTPPAVALAEADAKLVTAQANYATVSAAEENTAINAIVEENIQPLGTAPLLMGACGAVAVVAFGVSMITSPKEVPERDCPNHRCHDLSYYRVPPTPSQDALKAYLG